MAIERKGTGEPAVVSRDAHELQQLELKLSAHGQFMDVLHDLMRACEEPPPDSQLLRLLERSLEGVVLATESELGAFMVREKNDENLLFVLHHGDDASDTARWSPVPKNQGIAHWVAQHNRAAVVNNALADPRCGADIPGRGSTRIRSTLAVPVVNDDELLGVVEVINKRNGALYAKRDKKRLELICHFDGQLLAELVRRHPGS
jgi:GAF domain-containing protein